MTGKTLLTMLLCNLLWSLNVIISKIAVDDLGAPPLAYAFARSLLVCAVLFALLRPIPAQLWKVALVGLSISGGSFALLFMGLRYSTPSTAGVISLSGAPLTVLFAIIFLGERVRWKRGAGILLTFAGVLVSISEGARVELGGGVALLFGAAVVGALGSVFVKRLDISSIQLQAWAGVASALVLLPLTLVGEDGQIEALRAAPLELAACVFFAGVVVSVGAHSTYYRLLQQHDANQLVPLTLLTPLLTIFFGAILTGDEIGPRLLVGAALAIAGVAIIIVRPSETFTKRFLVRSRI